MVLRKSTLRYIRGDNGNVYEDVFKKYVYFSIEIHCYLFKDVRARCDALKDRHHK